VIDLKYFEVSCKTGEGVVEAFRKLAEEILNMRTDDGVSDDDNGIDKKKDQISDKNKKKGRCTIS
jgi:transcriptional regulatory protein LevR